MQDLLSPPEITPELIRRFDISGPRYTSYPTADRFVEAFGWADYERALEQRRTLTQIGRASCRERV